MGKKEDTEAIKIKTKSTTPPKSAAETPKSGDIYKVCLSKNYDFIFKRMKIMAHLICTSEHYNL